MLGTLWSLYQTGSGIGLRHLHVLILREQIFHIQFLADPFRASQPWVELYIKLKRFEELLGLLQGALSWRLETHTNILYHLPEFVNTLQIYINRVCKVFVKI